MNIKTHILFKNITNTLTTTFSQPTNMPGEIYQGFTSLDVVGVINTLSGTSPNITLNIQEAFDNTFVTTALASGITTTGSFFLTHRDNNAQGGTGYASPGTAKNIMLGKGMAKQVLMTMSGTISAINADIFFVFTNE